MDNIIWVIIPWVLLLGIYIYIFSRKRESERMKINLKRMDWITFFALIFGGVALASLWDASKIPFFRESWAAVLPILAIVVVFIVAIVVRGRRGKPAVQIIGDERLEAIYAKSSRNALFVTYLVLFIHATVNDIGTLDTNWLMILLGGGLFVLIASSIVYYYRKS
jgi:hypothetical protein